MIVKSTDDRIFDVTEIGLPQAWQGLEVKLVKGSYVSKARARPQLVRKAGARHYAATGLNRSGEWIHEWIPYRA